MNILPSPMFIVEAPESVIVGFKKFDDIPRDTKILVRLSDVPIGTLDVIVSPFWERRVLT